jgi:adenylate kinase
VIRRLGRRGREDDEAYVIKERLEVYSRETEPVLQYYRRRGVVTILDGNRPLDEVTDAIEQAVKAKKIRD